MGGCCFKCELGGVVILAQVSKYEFFDIVVDEIFNKFRRLVV